jgi:hypothetical protein
MKELIDFYMKDLKCEDFTWREWLVFGIGFPVLVVAGGLFGAWLGGL